MYSTNIIEYIYIYSKYHHLTTANDLTSRRQQFMLHVLQEAAYPSWTASVADAVVAQAQPERHALPLAFTRIAHIGTTWNQFCRVLHGFYGSFEQAPGDRMWQEVWMTNRWHIQKRHQPSNDLPFRLFQHVQTICPFKKHKVCILQIPSMYGVFAYIYRKKKHASIYHTWMVWVMYLLGSTWRFLFPPCAQLRDLIVREVQFMECKMRKTKISRQLAGCRVVQQVVMKTKTCETKSCGWNKMRKNEGVSREAMRSKTNWLEG